VERDDGGYLLYDRIRRLKELILLHSMSQRLNDVCHQMPRDTCGIVLFGDDEALPSIHVPLEKVFIITIHIFILFVE